MPCHAASGKLSGIAADGLGPLPLAIARYPRLPQPGLAAKVGHVLALGGVFAAVALYGNMARHDVAVEHYRTDLFATQISYGDAPVATVLNYELEVEIMKGGVPLAARAELQLANVNDVTLSTLIFTLNPGLAISSVADADGADLPFEIDGSVVRITPTTALAPHAEMTISMAYAGDIDREGFDLLRSAARIEKWQGPIHKGDLTAWIRERSAFLPPRSRWYPVPGVDYGNADTRPVSFFTGRISVDAPAGVEIITQGAPTTEAGGERGRALSVWDITWPVPQLSLNMGEYEIFSAEAGGIDVVLYVHPHHVAQLELFEDATEEVVGLVEQLLTAMAQETGLPYPYDRLAVVEVPFLVQWYYEGWEESGGLTQPGVLMIEEDTLVSQMKRMTQRVNRTMNSERGQSQDPARIKRDQLATAAYCKEFSPRLLDHLDTIQGKTFTELLATGFAAVDRAYGDGTPTRSPAAVPPRSRVQFPACRR